MAKDATVNTDYVEFEVYEAMMKLVVFADRLIS